MADSLVQAVVRGAPDHGGDAGAEGDHREAGVASEVDHGDRGEVLPPHLKMIDHGVTAGDRASHLTSVQYRMAVAALAPDTAFDVASRRRSDVGCAAGLHGHRSRSRPTRRCSPIAIRGPGLRGLTVTTPVGPP